MHGIVGKRERSNCVVDMHEHGSPGVRIYGCFMRVLSLNWNYGMCSARYRKIAADVGLAEPRLLKGREGWYSAIHRPLQRTVQTNQISGNA